MSLLVTALKILALVGIVIVLWSYIWVFGILLLLFIVYVLFVFLSTHSFGGSGDKPLSFYMGGEWLDDNAPSYDECVNAWIFMLSIAEDLAPSSDNIKRENLLKRAINILHLAKQSEVENIRIEERVAIPDLLCLLIDNKNAAWLLDELKARKVDLEFDLDKALESTKKSNVLDQLGLDWESKAKEFVNAEIASIPQYTEEQLDSYAQNICQTMIENDMDLEQVIEHYDFVSSKIEADHEWGENTVTQEGLRLIKDVWSIGRDWDLFNYDPRFETSDLIFEANQYNDFEFLFSKTTCEYKDKNVTVLADLHNVHGSFVWRVHDSPIYKEPEHSWLEGPVIWKVTLGAGDNKVIFDLNNHISNSSAKKFFNVLALLLSKK